MTHTSIVLGLGFGDEGKGVTTSFLVSKTDNPLVIRFNGGHQAGHTVVHNGHRHVFSNFGSGTLQGVPTYWSRFCTFYPLAVLNEYDALKEFSPVLYVDPLCPVATPFDLVANQWMEDSAQHGSCGVGFGATVGRHEAYYKIYVRDLFYPSVYKAKLDNIIKHYYAWLPHDKEQFRESFIRSVEEVKHIIRMDFDPWLYDHMIYEGSQGILLDMDHGFFPNVTRSNTTSKNVVTLLHEGWHRFMDGIPDTYYVTRSYQTRHGNGFMTNEDMKPMLVNNENETNKTNKYQGEFRIGALDADLINYALECDAPFTGYANTNKHLVMTCLDQTGESFPMTWDGKLLNAEINTLLGSINTHIASTILCRAASGPVEQITA